MALATGTRLGVYEITDSLGAGGMGEVYRARDTKLGRDVAIKTLPSALAHDRERLARFEREAQLLAALHHAHIASVFGLDEHDGTRYLAMELIEGETLDVKLARGALPVADALRLALQIAEALEAAHDKGVVHRDLKPANVMVTRDGAAKVLDFGLAKALAGATSPATAASSAEMTQVGTILGTAAYMSPEQATGQATDQRADVWAFGALLYELLTGRPAFGGESAQHILAAVLRAEPDWTRLPQRLHPRVKLLLERCLEKRVRDRYHSIADVRVDLEKTLADPLGATVAAQPARTGFQRALPLAAALALGAALASAYLLVLSRPEPPREAAAERLVSRYVITPPVTAPLASQPTGNIAISPDGKRIAYLAQKPANGNTEIWVRELDALEARPLPGTDLPTPINVMPFFSADGNAVGFYTLQRGIRSASIDGRPTIKIADSPERGFLGGAWLPDDAVVYSSGRRLERVALRGERAPEVVRPEGDEQIAAPVALPGGRALLFVVLGTERSRVAVLDLETGDEKELFEGSTAVYSETGHIVFARGTTLLAVPFDVDELAVTGEPVAVVQGVRHRSDRNAADFALSANGTLVYVPAPADDAAARVLWVDRAGNVIGPAVPDRLNNPRDPRLSRDGKRLLLVTGPVTEGDLWSYDLGGRPATPLALAGNSRLPVWSPDERRVVFTRWSGPTFDILSVASDGSDRAPQPIASQTAAPWDWSTAGDLIAFTPTRNADIVAMAVAAPADVRPVVVSDSVEFHPVLSPDERWLAFVSNRTGENEIWVQGYPDGVPVRVSQNGGVEPRWSANGRELFYIHRDEIMAVTVDTQGEFSFTAPVRLFGGSFAWFAGPDGGSYDVAPDGRFLMVERSAADAATPSGIVVVENWAEELRQRVRPLP